MQNTCSAEALHAQAHVYPHGLKLCLCVVQFPTEVRPELQTRLKHVLVYVGYGKDVNMYE